jgi:hypothetical protein
MRLKRPFKSLGVVAVGVFAVVAAAKVTNLKAQEQVAQSANRDSRVEDVDELFERAVERVSKWKNPAAGLLSSDNSAVEVGAGSAVAARAAVEAPAGASAGTPGVLNKRKDASRAAGGKSAGRGVASDPDKASGKPALPPTGRLVLASRAPEGARARDETISRTQVTTARSEERAAIQTLIQKQLNAFANHDSATAYSFAAPALRKRFPDEATFMRMVQGSYAAVYRHKHVVFGKLSDHGDGRSQAVKLTDQAGDAWLALYTVEKQLDGSWLISGCTLIKSDRARGVPFVALRSKGASSLRQQHLPWSRVLPPMTTLRPAPRAERLIG